MYMICINRYVFNEFNKGITEIRVRLSYNIDLYHYSTVLMRRYLITVRGRRSGSYG